MGNEQPGPVAARPRRAAAPSRDDVLGTALALIDADGVEKLSMRRLGQALDRDPMSLYKHAENKDALLDAIAEYVQLDLAADPTNTDWASELRHFGRAFRDVALAHPRAVPLVVTRPLAAPLGRRPIGTVRPLEDLLELLVRAGFASTDALSAARLFLGFLYGHVLNEVQELIDDPDETDDLLRLGLYRLPLRQFPRLRGLAEVLAGYDGAAELEVGLDILITGLERLRAPVIPLHAAGSPPGQRSPGSPDEAGDQPPQIPAGVRPAGSCRPSP